MSKKLLYIIAGLVLLLLVGGAFAFSQLNKSSDKEDSKNTEKASIQSLLGAGKNISCEVENEESKGTIYISDKKMRGDFDISSGGQSTKAYVIHDEQYSYIWASDSNQGTKLKIDASKPEAESNTSVDLDQEADVRCSDWSVDNSKFTPPSNITFTDLTSTVDEIQHQSDEAKQQQRAVCEQLEEPTAKAYCLDALE